MPGRIRLFFLSVLVLYLELVLIRWLGTEIRIFAYLQNTILVSCFLGFGIGCLTPKAKTAQEILLIFLLVLVAMLSLPATRAALAEITPNLSFFPDLNIWYPENFEGTWTDNAGKIGKGLMIASVVLFLTMMIFVQLGSTLAEIFRREIDLLPAYSVNIAGSLAGIVLFSLSSKLNMGPAGWVLLLALLVAVSAPAKPRRLSSVLCCMLALVGLANHLLSTGVEVFWSPYQKLEVVDQPIPKATKTILVNNVGYQTIFDLHEDIAPTPGGQPITVQTKYDMPTTFQPDAEHVLVVGAGTGNDVAGALRGGAKNIDAVEIDPVILNLGRKYHPEQPYSSPRVRTIVNDARSYFGSSDTKYDLIIFGLLDSHTTFSTTNTRLDNYVYTDESLHQVRSLLKEHGIVIVSFYSQNPDTMLQGERWNFLTSRFDTILTNVFGQKPVVLAVPSDWPGFSPVFIVGDAEKIDATLKSHPELKALQVFDDGRAEAGSITTDDWPYLYQRSNTIPDLYLIFGGLIALMFFVVSRIATGRYYSIGRFGRQEFHFFALGGAFLLLEIHNVSKAALVLGSTWEVNSAIIATILVLILAANRLIENRPALSPALLFGGLYGTLLINFFVDASMLPAYSTAVRGAVFCLMSCSPIFFAGMIFARSFSRIRDPGLCLGANTLGALVGGLLQSVSFVCGVRFLLVLVGVLYLTAMILDPGGLSRAKPVPR